MLDRKHSIALCLTTLLGAMTSACKPKACGDVGCESVVTMQMDLPDLEQLKTATLKACRNGKCATGSAADLQKDDLNLVYLGSDELPINVTIQDGALECMWFVSRQTNKGGDSYSFTATSADGKVLLDVSGKANSFSSFYPNGKECGPTCNAAAIDERNTKS